jgi:hypothetical protein
VHSEERRHTLGVPAPSVCHRTALSCAVAPRARLAPRASVRYVGRSEPALGHHPVEIDEALSTVAFSVLGRLAPPANLSLNGVAAEQNAAAGRAGQLPRKTSLLPATPSSRPRGPR